MIPFIDVSSHNQGFQGIDWPAVASYLLSIHPEAGVIVKATQGTWYTNEYLHQQRQGAHAAGIKNVGLYAYAEFSVSNGADQADHLMDAIGKDGGLLAGEFLALDNEDPSVPSGADLDAACLDFLGRLNRPLGILPLHYSAHYYLADHNLTSDSALAKYPLWYASWQPTIPPTPTPWPKILLWQYTASGKVPGIDGIVDMSLLNGTIDELRPSQWGNQPDPLAGKAVGTADVSGDVPTILKRILADAQAAGQTTIAADAGLALQAFGLLP